MTKKKTKKDEQPTFEETYETLETIVHELESGDMTLDDSLSAYEKGISALKHCYSVLETAEKKIEVLTLAQDGDLATEPVHYDEFPTDDVGDEKVLF